MQQHYNFPDQKGHFGAYGGNYSAETLFEPLKSLALNYEEALKDPNFKKEFTEDLKSYVGRETPLYHAKNLTKYAGGAEIYLKREDLNHTGAHKINNTIGQALLAKRMGENSNYCRNWCWATWVLPVQLLRQDLV